jgi:uncharacterized protein (DUF305 family)
MSDASHAHMPGRQRRGGVWPYLVFWIMMALSFVVMYAAMFTMIDGWGDFRNNLNMFYMTVTMWAPMGIIMLLAMRGMYANKKANLAMLVAFAVLTVVAFAGTRTQALIDDRQFIDSMIPHHSGAILMCREADLTDVELVSLCEEISAGQRAEIEQMEQIRDRLDQ